MFTITLIISAAMLSFSSFSYKDEEGQLHTAFEHTGAEFVNWELYAWSKLEGQDSKSYDVVKFICQRMYNSIGVLKNNKFTMNEINSAAYRQIEINGEIDNGIIMNIKGIVENSVENRVENRVKNSDGTPQFSYVSANIMIDKPNANYSEIRAKLAKAFVENNLKPCLNSCITGSLEGKVASKKLNTIFTKAFNQIGAVKVDAVKDYNLISVSAYCPSIKDYIRIKEARVNINLAIRYNSYEKKTYIWLATPIITKEY
jgi:hypothetical protein